MAVSVLDMVTLDGYSFYAKAQQVISGGMLVKAMSTAAASTSRPDEILEVDRCDAAGDNATCVGIALHGAGSTDMVTVATRGIYRMYAAGAIVVGAEVSSSADPLAVLDSTFTCAGSTNALVYLKPIGTALSTAASGEKVFVHLNV